MYKTELHITSHVKFNNVKPVITMIIVGHFRPVFFNTLTFSICFKHFNLCYSHFLKHCQLVKAKMWYSKKTCR